MLRGLNRLLFASLFLSAISFLHAKEITFTGTHGGIYFMPRDRGDISFSKEKYQDNPAFEINFKSGEYGTAVIFIQVASDISTHVSDATLCFSARSRDKKPAAIQPALATRNDPVEHLLISQLHTFTIVSPEWQEFKIPISEFKGEKARKYYWGKTAEGNSGQIPAEFDFTRILEIRFLNQWNEAHVDVSNVRIVMP